MDPIAALAVYELRWVCRGREGRCFIRGVSEDDVVEEFTRHPDWYGAPGDRALAVYAAAVRAGEVDDELP